MKSEKGLTFFSTIILVIVIALIAFCVVYFLRMQVDKEKAEDERVDILKVQAKVKNISGNYLLDKEELNLVGIGLSDMKEEQTIKEFLERDIFDPEEKGKKYYVLNKQNLDSMGLEKVELEEGHYYIAEYMTGEVYYTKGYADENGQIHYKATELEKTEQKDEDKVKNETNNVNAEK